MPLLEHTNIQGAFAVPVMIHNWDDSREINNDLLTSILARERNNPNSSMRSNVGGWHSTDDLDKWTGEAGKRLAQRIIDMVNHATTQIYANARKSEQDVQWGIGLWANVNRKGDYNNVHSHPYSTWSGVYYVDAGDPPEGDKPSGSFTFLTPNLAEANTFFTKVVPQSTSIRPTSGLMLLFPSYLQHFVHPYDGDRPRVSIAFNATKQPWP